MPDNDISAKIIPAPIEEASELLEAAPETVAILNLFEQMDATAPLMRLIIAASIVGVSLLLLMISRIVIRRRIRKLEAIPESRFKPLRWQAQDLVSAEDMQKFWLRLWRGLDCLLSLGFGLVAVTGMLMTNSWTLQLGPLFDSGHRADF